MNLWNGIYGHSSAKLILETILSSNSIPHALIFNGQKGIGKDFLALRFAQILEHKNNLSRIIKNSNFLSQNIKYIIPLPRGKGEGNDDSPLDKFLKDELKIIVNELQKKCSNPYYRINIPKAYDIKINSIREVNRFLSLTTEPFSYRFIIISNAEQMNDESQNALLKNLEEPPEKTIFILTTNNTNKLKDTIKSRCWNLNFEPLERDDLSKILSTYFKLNFDISDDFLELSNGSVDNSLSLIDNNYLALKEKSISILRYALGSKFHSAFKEFNFLQKNDQQFFLLDTLIKLIQIWLIEVQNDRSGIKAVKFNDYLDTIKKFNQNYSEVEVESCVQVINKYIYLLKENNINLNIIIINLIFELNSIITNRY
jgi:DNA polymerase-3 subunit delta'